MRMLGPMIIFYFFSQWRKELTKIQEHRTHESHMQPWVCPGKFNDVSQAENR